jgi:gas vesicle protein
MSKNCNSVNSFLIGAAVGAVLGILFAPESGDDTREKLKNLKEDNDEIIEETRDNAEDIVEKTLAAIDQGFSKLSDMIDEKKPPKKSTPKNEASA